MGNFSENNTRKDTLSCPLCNYYRTRTFYSSRLKNLERDYLRCHRCDLIFVPRQFHLSPELEKTRYREHNNHPYDPKYRKFLSKLYDELVPHLTSGSKGIDYGSGTGPALVTMLEETGFEMQTYDLFFQPDRSVLSKPYHFITCTETAEHFANPKLEFQTLDSMLEPGGWVGIMTSILKDTTQFPCWHYHRDPTHIAFYSERTMHFIAGMFHWEIFFPRENIVLFQKTNRGTHTTT